MDAHIPPQLSNSSSQARTGLAIACLVLGILAVFASILVVGAVIGILGILLGAIHIVKRRGPNGMAWIGIALSLLSIVLSVALGGLYLKGFKAAKSGWDTMGEGSVANAHASTPEFADWLGEPLPAFTVTTLDGTVLSSEALRGRRVVLDFWATWCPPCRREIPHFIQLSQEHDPEELLIIGISSEDEETLSAFVGENSINYPIVSTDALPPPFDEIISIPTTFFITRDGVIQNVVVGYHDYDHLEMLALADDEVPEADDPTTDQP